MQGCGFRVYQEPDGIGFLPASIEKFDFQPSLHVFCGDTPAEALQRFKDDGLPKFRDLPKIWRLW